MISRLIARMQLRSLRQLLAAAIAVRLVVDTTSQLFSPFLATFAAGTGVSIVVLGRLLSLRGSMGILAPLFGSLADRYGYRLVMRLGLLIAAVGMLIIGISNSFLILTLGMVLSGLGISTFVPVLQAYLSERLPYERRAQGIGMLEYSWALASIVGLFLIGFLIENAGWRAPFFVLAGGLMLSWLLFGLFPPAHEDGQRPQPNAPLRWRTLPASTASFFQLGERAGSAYANILAHGLLFFAGFHVFITFGGWLELQYGLPAASLGTVALILGVADLGGSVTVSLITDRVGKRRSVISGTLLAALSFGLLPFLNLNLALAVVGLALTRVTFEFAIVSDISLLSEQIQSQRGKVMTLGSSAALAGGTVAGFTGPWAYQAYGVWGLGIPAAIATLLSAIVLLLRVQE